MTGASNQLGDDNDAGNRRAGQTMGEKSEAAKETAGRSAAEGTASANMENQVKINSSERQDVTHQEAKICWEGSTSTGFNSTDTSNKESGGVMMCARHAKSGIKTDRDSGSVQRADGYGKSSGYGHTVVSINNNKRYGNPNARTDARSGD